MAARKKTKAHFQRQGKRAREKGKRYERDCAKALQKIFPEARRLFGQARKGHDAPDIGNTPFWVECGFGTSTEIREKLNQGLRDTSLCEDPRYKNKLVIAMTSNRKNEHIVSMRRDQFLELVEAVEAAWRLLEEE